MENFNIKVFNNKKKNFISKIQQKMIALAVLEKDNSVGFSIYFPGRKADYNLALRYENGILPSVYEETQFAIDTNWDEFLKIYLNISNNDGFKIGKTLHAKRMLQPHIEGHCHQHTMRVKPMCYVASFTSSDE